MRIRLTDKVLRGLSTTQSQEDFWDLPGLPNCGFGIRVTSKGIKTWQMTYTCPETGKRKRMTLGTYIPDRGMGLAEARQKALDSLAELGAGEVPTAAKSKQPTFEETTEDFLTVYPKQRALRPATVKEYRRQIENELVPVFGNRMLKSIRRRDIVQFLDSIAFERVRGSKDGKKTVGSPVMANRLKATLSCIFTFAQERELIDVNPCFRLADRTEEKSRDRVLTEEEIRKLWADWSKRSPVMSASFKIMLVTGARSAEVKRMRWADIDEAEMLWTIPAETAKNGREHVLPLTDTVLKLLRGLPRTSDYVFAADTIQGHMQWMQKTTARIRKDTGIEWTSHDLRRSCATWLSRIGVDDLLIGRILNHRWAEANMTNSVYNRDRRIPEMRAALEDWDAKVKTILRGEPGAKIKRISR